MVSLVFHVNLVCLCILVLQLTGVLVFIRLVYLNSLLFESCDDG